ncbi:MAG: hypothetical protein LQ340_002204 [Diploschistes diacapsis]|nr:MAG: hypothetical protein LQ340_002204 [Diploschistes diacapsis]
MSLPAKPAKDHHVGDPPTHFQNPWPSFVPHTGGLWDLVSTRFSSNRNFVPIPETREELVKVQKPTWGHTDKDNGSRLKATWMGHASWLLEFPAAKEYSGIGSKESDSANRGVTVLLDPVFANRTSPTKWIGPRRYSPLPCTIADLPEVDLIVISHNHYDHLDYDAIKELHRKSARTQFFCPLKNKSWFVGAGIPEALVHELDWWDAAAVTVHGIGSIAVVCTPAQHSSARTPFDRDTTLWSSWVCGGIAFTDAAVKTEDAASIDVSRISDSKLNFSGHRVYFAGDTGYRTVENAQPSKEEEAAKPRCPAFKEIGEYLGPFDLALVPIGLYSPRSLMSNVHCCPEDSVCLHMDIKSKKTIGMHYGTFRGGLSGQYEDVREPPRRFQAECKKAGLRWGEEVGLCDIGETVMVDGS